MYQHKNESNCKVKNRVLAGMFGLALPLFFLAGEAQAQVCDSAFATSPTISPISGSKVVVGQTIIITKLFFGSSDPANCLFRNGEGFLLYPNGTVVRVVTNLDLNPPGVPPFNSFLNCFGTNSIQPEGTVFAFTTSYVVSAADVGKSNSIILPIRGQFSVPRTIPFPGSFDTITFGSAGDTDGFNPADGTSPTGVAAGSGSQFLTVVSPGLTVTKVCDSNCFLYGAPITFHGTVCNTGNVDLVNVVVSNTLAGSATVFVANFPILPAGQCSNYFGSEIPAGNLCGPFTNTVVASGVAASVFQTPIYAATNSAICTVCVSPCITVTKACTTALLGQTQIISGAVTNCGDVTLTNIVVTDNVLGVVTNVASLAPNGFFLYSKTFTASACGTNVDFVTARGTSLCGVVVQQNGTNACVVTCTQTCPPVTNSINSGFNGTPISTTNFIWFNANFSASGIPSTGATLFLNDATITITSKNGNFTCAVPSAEIVFSPSATCATTVFDGTQWVTTVPVGGSDEILLTALGIRVPANLQAANVAFSGEFTADKNGISINWKWGAAVYTTDMSQAQYNNLGVKPTHTSACLYNNSDHAGTPENVKKFVVGGARGGGGSNFTGSWSGTGKVTLCP